jgi:hypothetical protein
MGDHGARMDKEVGKGKYLSILVDVIYATSLMLGPITLPVALFVNDVENRWVSFVATPIFLLSLLTKRWMANSAVKHTNDRHGGGANQS